MQQITEKCTIKKVNDDKITTILIVHYGELIYFIVDVNFNKKKA